MDFIDFQKQYRCYRNSEYTAMFMKPKSFPIDKESAYFVLEKKYLKIRYLIV